MILSETTTDVPQQFSPLTWPPNKIKNDYASIKLKTFSLLNKNMA